MKRIKCLLEGHRWLLQRELPTNDELSIYEYQCQRCSKIKTENIIKVKA